MKVFGKTVLLSICFSMLFVAVKGYGEDCAELLKKEASTFSLLQKQQILAKAVERCPDSAEINFKYAYVLERLRKYKKALAHYEKASQLDPNNPKYLFGLGDIYRFLGKKKEALTAYRAGLYLEPGNKRIKKNVEDLIKELSEPKRAQKVDVEVKKKQVVVKEEKKPEKSPPPKKKKKEVKVEKRSIALKFSTPYNGRICGEKSIKRLLLKDDTHQGDMLLRDFLGTVKSLNKKDKRYFSK